MNDSDFRIDELPVPKLALGVLYAHVDDTVVPGEETIGAMGELRERGLVREIAASNLTAGRLLQALSTEENS